MWFIDWLRIEGPSMGVDFTLLCGGTELVMNVRENIFGLDRRPADNIDERLSS